MCVRALSTVLCAVERAGETPREGKRERERDREQSISTCARSESVRRVSLYLGVIFFSVLFVGLLLTAERERLTTD